MKKYIIPQTVFIKVQPQAMLVGSVQIEILPGEEMNSDEMEAKKWDAYDEWGEYGGE